MDLSFERGDRANPVGHALVYFRSGDGSILASYLIVPPIEMDIGKLLPPMFASMMQGMDFGTEVSATPIPPIPDKVPSAEYLSEMARFRGDDLIFLGHVGDVMSAAAQLQEAAQSYYQLYAAVRPSDPAEGQAAPAAETEFARFATMSQQEQLNELTMLTGRLRDSLKSGPADGDLVSQMRQLAEVMPAKYRVSDLIEAASTPGERGQRLAELYIQRSYKLFNEEYLDLERIDRDIAETLG